MAQHRSKEQREKGSAGGGGDSASRREAESRGLGGAEHEHVVLAPQAQRDWRRGAIVDGRRRIHPLQCARSHSSIMHSRHHGGEASGEEE